MEAIREFLLRDVDIANKLTVQMWMIVSLAIAVLVLVIVIISAVLHSKKKANKPDSATLEESSVVADTDESLTEFSVPESEPAAEETMSNELDEPKNDAASEPKKTPAKETVSEPKEEAPVAAVKEQAVAEKATAEKATAEKAAAEKAAAEKAAAEKVEETDAEKDADVEREESYTHPRGKFEICNSNIGGFRYLLYANNGQLLFESRDYKSSATCGENIERFISAVEGGAFRLRMDKFGNYRFVLQPPNNSSVQFYGETFRYEKSCLSNMESIKRFATRSTPVIDMTEKDFVAKSTEHPIPYAVRKAVDDNQGAPGKYEIVNINPADKKSPFIYLLYANNGQLLFESREYKTYAGCRNGLEAFIRALVEGVFLIDPDKSGKYKFVLRNKIVEYVGQNYSTKKAACSNAESVYKFGLMSSIKEL